MTNRGAILGWALGPLLAASVAAAQGLSFGAAGDKPIQVEADDGIEWHRDTQKYIARGRASARQGDISVDAEALTAYYRDAPGGGTEIFRIEADGAVRISSPSETATGDKAIFDVQAGVLVMTGKRVALKTPQETITARDSLEYYVQRQLAIARGDARASRGQQHLSADVLMAHYRDRAGGGRQSSDLERVDAVGNVVIVTPEDVIKAERGDYDPNNGIARLAGGVRLTRGTTQLSGERAEVNLNTGVSRLLGAAQPGEQVRGLFVPKSKPAEGPRG